MLGKLKVSPACICAIGLLLIIVVVIIIPIQGSSSAWAATQNDSDNIWYFGKGIKPNSYHLMYMP
jgi:hypothetical protein